MSLVGAVSGMNLEVKLFSVKDAVPFAEWRTGLQAKVVWEANWLVKGALQRIIQAVRSSCRNVHVKQASYTSKCYFPSLALHIVVIPSSA